MVNDLRYAIRMLRKSPGFTAVAVLTLALGIGANTAIFSVVNTVLLRPLPFQEAQQLVTLWERDPKRGYDDNEPAASNFRDWKAQNQVFDQMAVFDSYYNRFNISGEGRPERVEGAAISANLFQVLGVWPMIGRTFLEEEDQPGRDQVVLLSYNLWRRRFGADPALVGKTILLNARNVSVVGVMPPGCQFPGGTGKIPGAYTNKAAELWVPLALDVEAWNRRSSHYLQAIARLKPEVTLNQAAAEMNALQQRIQQQYPQEFVGSEVKLVPLRTQVVGSIRPALLVLLGAVAFVLLIAGANVANLLLARAAGRRKEIAIRAVLGASRFRVIRQALTESMLLALFGGILGTVLAWWGKDFLVRLSPEDVSQIRGVQIDGWVLGFTLGLSLLTGVIFGIAPALQATEADVNESLKEGGWGASDGLGRNRVRSFLVVAEVGLALVLLTGAGLMIQSFMRLEQVNPGFQPDYVSTLQISVPEVKYSTEQQQAAFFQQVLRRVETVPGVEAVGTTTALPLTGANENYGIEIEGHPLDPSLEAVGADYRAVSAGYFHTLRIPLIRGRRLTERDTKDAAPVILINQTFAHLYFANENPLGKRVRIGHGRSRPEIVGVVEDVRHLGLDAEIHPEIYEPFLQVPWSSMTLVVRTSLNPTTLAAVIQREVLSLDKDQPVSQVMTMDQIVADSVGQPRFRTLLLGLFGTLALILATVGIYGVMSYSVNQRIHEIGIRMALGADRNEVLRLVVGQGLTLTMSGLAVGLAGAFALTRVLATFLYGVSTTDPATFAGVSLLLVGAALLACYIPARRATNVDPMVALRYE